MSGLTHRGRLLAEIMAGHTVRGVCRSDMERLCVDLGDLRPRRFLRAEKPPGGGYDCTMIGAPIIEEQLRGR